MSSRVMRRRILINFYPKLNRGGGERHLLEIAVTLSRDHDVTLLSVGDPDFSEIARLFHLPLDRITVRRYRDLASPLVRWLDRCVCRLKPGNVYHKMFTCHFAPRVVADYDLFVNSETGDFIPNAAKRGVHVMYFPCPDGAESYARPSLLHRLYRLPYRLWKQRADRQPWATYHDMWCISDYTRRHSLRFGLPCHVLYPPIDAAFQPGPKERIILLVGRFAPDDAKGQKHAIDVFRRFSATDRDNWTLVCAGSLVDSPNAWNYFESLRAAASGLPVRLLPNLPFPDLAELTSRASLFWHLMGAGIDLHTNPVLAEHFGMPTVEAMMAGAVPVGFNGGGQPEIIEHGVSGFLWSTDDELLDFTRRLTADDDLRQRMAEAAQQKARDFSRESFEEQLLARVNALFDSLPSNVSQ